MDRPLDGPLCDRIAVGAMFICLLSAPISALGQGQTLKEQIVGAWRTVSKKLTAVNPTASSGGTSHQTYVRAVTAPSLRDSELMPPPTKTKGLAIAR